MFLLGDRNNVAVVLSLSHFCIMYKIGAEKFVDSFDGQYDRALTRNERFAELDRLSSNKLFLLRWQEYEGLVK